MKTLIHLSLFLLAALFAVCVVGYQAIDEQPPEPMNRWQSSIDQQESNYTAKHDEALLDATCKMRPMRRLDCQLFNRNVLACLRCGEKPTLWIDDYSSKRFSITHFCHEAHLFFWADGRTESATVTQWNDAIDRTGLAKR